MTDPAAAPVPDPLSLTPEALYALVYDELKRIARSHRRASDANATISTTELVHEAYLKLSPGPSSGWEGRAHFFGAASRAMRQVLVEFARRRGATKRGGDMLRVSLGDSDVSLDAELETILTLDAALERLNLVDERLRQIVELRFFAGLTEEEVASILGVSARTIERNWIKARLFLLDEIERGR